MRSRKVLVGLTSLAATSALFVGTAHADRRTGLGGNLLITDPDDLFPFPQYTLQHRNMIRLDYGGSATSGNGVFTLGDDNMAYGIALHRGDLLNPDTVGFGTELVWLGGVGDPFADGGAGNNGTFAGPGVATVRPAGVQQGAFGGAAAAAAGAPVPATVVDLVFGSRLTGTSMWGARVGFGRGVQAVDNDGDVTKGATNIIALQAGYSSLPEGGLRYDVSGNVVVGLGKSTDAAGDDLASGYDLRLGLLARGYKPVNEVLDIGFLGNLSGNFESVSNDAADFSSNDFGLGIMGGVGPAIHLERAQIATYAGVLAAFGNSEPNDDVDDDETSHLQFAVPTVNMAAEVQLLDWMYVRTSGQYSWDLTRDKDGADVSQKLGTGNFLWSAGLGVTKSNFFLDGVISNSFMTNGPAFIGGGTPGFLAMASLTYKFGDVLSGAPAPAPEPAAVAPAPAPAPLEPSPAQEASPAVDASGTATGTTTETGVSGTTSGSLNIGQ